MRNVLRYLPLPLFLIVTTSVHGDGIPVAPDRKSLTVESFTIPLNKDQVTQVERLRKVSLTKEQLAPLWAIYDKVPQTIEVVSSRYDSCTCDMDVYGIWCRPGEIQIPKYSLEFQEEDDAREAEHPAQDDEPDHDLESNHYDSESLILDSAGNIYHDGKELQEADVITLIDAMHERKKQNDRLECSIGLDVPPPVDDVTDARIRELAKRIETHCNKRNINFWALGLSAEKYR